MCDSVLILNDLNDSYIDDSVDLVLFVIFHVFLRYVLLLFLT